MLLWKSKSKIASGLFESSSFRGWFYFRSLLVHSVPHSILRSFSLINGIDPRWNQLSCRCFPRTHLGRKDSILRFSRVSFPFHKVTMYSTWGEPNRLTFLLRIQHRITNPSISSSNRIYWYNNNWVSDRRTRLLLEDKSILASFRAASTLHILGNKCQYHHSRISEASTKLS